ncbi:hypothetical protein ILYODFUR_022829 [Ilyodon furcidens]|uniref:Uncharacterized protein n=1 Tax=Ilyodon furcidens TaxID=33524 RepID=A0ABV0TWX6_9TELE
MHTLIHTHTPKGHLDRAINLTVMFSNVGESRSTRREPTHARGKHVNSMQKEPPAGSPGTQELLAARQQRYQQHTRAAQKVHTSIQCSFQFVGWQPHGHRKFKFSYTITESEI